MKAHVYVTLKTSVLDPQGQTIQNALRKIGFADVTAVRQGKYFALSLADGLSADAARAMVERIAKEVLTNPVIEEFTYKIENRRAPRRDAAPAIGRDFSPGVKPRNQPALASEVCFSAGAPPSPQSPLRLRWDTHIYGSLQSLNSNHKAGPHPCCSSAQLGAKRASGGRPVCQPANVRINGAAPPFNVRLKECAATSKSSLKEPLNKSMF